MNSSSSRMGQAPLLPLLLSMSLPVMFSLLVQAFYSIADSFFVARISGEALTAVSLVMPLQNLITAIASGTGVGVNALMARALGAGDKLRAGSVAVHGVLLGVLNWAVFTLVWLPLLRPYLSAFTSTAAVVELGQAYAYPVIVCSLGLFVENICTRALQAQGNVRLPVLFQAGGAVLNLVLDPLLIFGLAGFPRLGVVGAALATVISQLAVMACCLWAATRPACEARVTPRGFRPCLGTVREIYVMGLPSIVMQSLYSFYIAGLNAILASFSDAAVTALGIYYKLQTFITMPILGLNQGLLPILSYNYGARLIPRMWRVLRHACVLATATLLAGMALFLLFPAQLMALFSPSAELLAIGIPALRIISTSFPLFAFTLLIPTLFQVAGHGGKSIALTLLRQVVLLVPLAYVFSRFGLVYLWLTFPVSELISTLLACRFARSLYRSGKLSPAEAVQPAQE